MCNFTSTCCIREQRHPVGRYTLEAFAFMSTANFVTVALTVTGRWAKAGEGEREDGCVPGSEGKRGGRESCSRAVFVLVVPKQHGGTRGPPFEIICWESVVKEEFMPPFLYRAIHRNICICPDSTHLPKCNEQTSGEGKSPRRRTCADCGSHTPCCSAAWVGSGNMDDGRGRECAAAGSVKYLRT